MVLSTMRFLWDINNFLQIILFSFFCLGNYKQVIDGSEFGFGVLVTVIASVLLFLVGWCSVFYGREQVCIDASDSVTAFYKIIPFLLYAHNLGRNAVQSNGAAHVGRYIDFRILSILR